MPRTSRRRSSRRPSFPSLNRALGWALVPDAGFSSIWARFDSRESANPPLVGEYVYDGNGNRVAHVVAAGTVEGQYDDQDRLTQYCPVDGLGDPAPGLGLPCLQYAYNESGQLQVQTDLASGDSRDLAG